MSALNSILERLIPGTVTAPKLDCIGCAKTWKCCDFQPFVANFLVGALIEANPKFLFTGPHLWQPLGLIPSHEFRARHAATSLAVRGEDLVCQFFDKDTRGCTIWEFRPGECSTYFCEGMGRDLQKLSARSFGLETALAQRALFEVGLAIDLVGSQIDLLNEPAEFKTYSDEELRKIYRDCWAWARNLNEDDVSQWL